MQPLHDFSQEEGENASVFLCGVKSRWWTDKTEIYSNIEQSPWACLRLSFVAVFSIRCDMFWLLNFLGPLKSWIFKHLTAENAGVAIVSVVSSRLPVHLKGVFVGHLELRGVDLNPNYSSSTSLWSLWTNPLSDSSAAGPRWASSKERTERRKQSESLSKARSEHLFTDSSSLWPARRSGVPEQRVGILYSSPNLCKCQHTYDNL